MGKKGTPHRKWSKEEKLYYIHLHLDEHLSVMEIERRHGVRNSLVSAWVKRYLEEGEDALEPKNGNPYAALHTSKTLSEVDRLRPVSYTHLDVYKRQGPASGPVPAVAQQ